MIPKWTEKLSLLFFSLSAIGLLGYIMAAYLGFDSEHSKEFVPVFAQILAALIAFIGLYYVTVRQIEYSREKDKELKYIEEIYVPCLQGIKYEIYGIRHFNMFGYADAQRVDERIGWPRIKEDYLVFILKKRSPEIYNHLKQFYSFENEQLRIKNAGVGIGRLHKIFQEELLERIKDNKHYLDAQNEYDDSNQQSILRWIISVISLDSSLFVEFLAGNSIKQVSQNHVGRDGNLIGQFEKMLRRDNYLQYLEPSPAVKLEDMLLTIYRRVNTDEIVERVRKRQASYLKEAKRIEAELEKLIV